MLLNPRLERTRAGPEATYAALWSEGHCPFDEAAGGTPIGDPRVVARLFRKLKSRQPSPKKTNQRSRKRLSRPQLEEET